MEPARSSRSGSGNFLFMHVIRRVLLIMILAQTNVSFVGCPCLVALPELNTEGTAEVLPTYRREIVEDHLHSGLREHQRVRGRRGAGSWVEPGSDPPHKACKFPRMVDMGRFFAMITIEKISFDQPSRGVQYIVAVAQIPIFTLHMNSVVVFSPGNSSSRFLWLYRPSTSASLVDAAPMSITQFDFGTKPSVRNSASTVYVAPCNWHHESQLGREERVREGTT